MAGVVHVAGALAASGASLRGMSITQQQTMSCSARRCSTFRVRAEATEATPSSVALNPGIMKETDKVVDTVVVGELSKPLTAYCRCWRSGTFPLCDGTHAKYNKATGDNVGPLLVKK